MATGTGSNAGALLLGAIAAGVVAIGVVTLVPSPNADDTQADATEPAALADATETEDVTGADAVIEVADANQTADAVDVIADAPQIIPPTRDTFLMFPDGYATIAGKASPNVAIDVVLGGEIVEQLTADASGQYSATLFIAPSDQPRSMRLIADPDGAKVASVETYFVQPVAVVAAVQDTDMAVATTDTQADADADEVAANAAETDVAVGNTLAGPETGATNVVDTGTGTDDVVADATDTAATPEVVDATIADNAEAVPVEAATEDDAVVVADSNAAEAVADEPDEPVVLVEIPVAQTPEEADVIALADVDTGTLPVMDENDGADVVANLDTSTVPAQDEIAASDITVADDVAPSEAGDAVTDMAAADNASEPDTATAAETAEADTIDAATVTTNVADGDDRTDPATVSPSSPAVLVADADGVRVLQPAISDQAPEVMSTVALDTITYDAAGEVLIAGRALGEGFVQVYLDNQPITTSRIESSGDWQIDLPDVDTGIYTLRIDEVTEEGDVVSRIETPFQREEADDVAAVFADETQDADFDVAVRTVQPGSTLWAIAREELGEGIMYVAVFEANKDRIRDPNLIYPGQIFRMPAATE